MIVAVTVVATMCDVISQFGHHSVLVTGAHRGLSVTDSDSPDDSFPNENTPLLLDPKTTFQRSN